MLFNSIEYIIFLPLVVLLYFLIPHRFRWILLLIASYYFYASWKFEYAFLLALSTLIDYIAGLLMEKRPKGKRKKILWISLSSNLLILFGFKYFNFVNHSLGDLFKTLSISYHIPAFDVLLPVGISFYTFQSMSYAIDVYRGTRKAEHHLGIFALYVSFFPQLVAGPIERSTRLMPQFYKKMEFDWNRIKSGLWLILWGLFQKVVIADRLAVYINTVYATPDQYNSLQILFALYLFPWQLLCDFSGYTDIAIGSARIMGYDLMKNFNRPFSSKNMRELWDRWHMSLTGWLKDYLFVPLAMKYRAKWQRALIGLFVFLLMGIWHGAAWNFVVFGLYAGIVFVISYSTRSVREKLVLKILSRDSRIQMKIKNAYQVIITFHLIMILGLTFRISSVGTMIDLLYLPLKKLDFTINKILAPGFSWYEFMIGIVCLLIYELYYWFKFNKYRNNTLVDFPVWFRWILAYLLMFAVLLLGEYNLKPFIYFQF